MFLAHFSSTALDTIMEYEPGEIIFWYETALTVYNKLNKVED